MTHPYTKASISFIILLGVLISAKFLIFNVSLTVPNLTNICVGGGYQNLGNIVITEANDDDFTATTNGNFLRLQITGNFEFEPSVGSVSVASGGGDDLSNASISVSTTQVIIFYDADASNQNDIMTISGLRVRAITAAGTGSVRMTGGAAITGITMNTTDLATFSSVAPPNVNLVDSDADNIICASESVTFTASGASTYQFKINGNNVVNGVDGTISGANGEVFTTTTLTNGVIVSVVGTGTTCTNTATSTSFTVNPAPYVALSTTPATAAICNGDNMTFTATSNGTQFIFYRNNVAQQSGPSKIWNTTSLSNGDIVRVDASFGGSCPIQSNNIGVTVNPIPTVGFVSPPDTDFTDNYGYAVYLSNGATYGGSVSGSVVATNQGVYSGPGVIDNKFYPIVAGAGNHTIVFTYTTPEGCSNTASIVMRVTAASSVVNNLNNSYCEFSGLQPASAPYFTAKSISYTYISGKSCTLTPTATVTMTSYRFVQAEYPTNAVVFVTGTPVNTYRLNVNNYPVNIDYDWVQLNGTYNCTGDCADYGIAAGANTRTFYQYFSIVANPVLSFTGFTDGNTFCPYPGTQIDLNVSDNGVSIEGAPGLVYEISETSAVAGFGTLTNGFTPASGIIDLTHSAYTSSNAPKDFWIRVSYTNASGCSATSVARRFRINPLPQPNFTGLNAFYCEGVATDELFMTNGLAEAFNYNNAYFVVRNNSNTIIAVFFPNALDQFMVNFNTYAAGNYTVAARYTSTAGGCYAESATQPFEIRPSPVLSFTGLQAAYCANVASSLLQGQSGGSDVFTGTFEVRQVFPSVTAYELLTTNRFSPQQPLPSQPPSQPTADANYEIRFTYTNASGCTSQISQYTVVRALPTPSFNFPAANQTGATTAEICRDANTITLDPLVGGSSPNLALPAVGKFLISRTSPTAGAPFLVADNLDILDFASPQFAIPTNTNDVYVYDIAYVYTDGNGCSDTSAIKTLTVNPSPTVLASDITITNRCLGDVTQFTVNYSRPISSYEWSGTEIPITTTTANTFSFAYTTTGTKNINLTITNPQGCKQTVQFTIEIKAKPQPNFSFLGQCLGSPTTFGDQTVILPGGDAVTSWNWDFGDGTFAATQNPSHIYGAAGTYNVTLTVQTNGNPDLSCPMAISKQVTIFDQHSPTATNPYIETFNANNGGWRAGQTTPNTGSWQYGTLTTTLNKIRPKDGAFWRTYVGALAADTIQYRGNEQSYIESPCFDLTGLDRPAISFDYWTHTRFGQDGAALLYTVNDGVTWFSLGGVNQGVEWYNAAGITSLPGSGSPGLPNGSLNGWSGDTQTDWKTARFILDNVKNLAGVGGRIRFRIVFASLPLGPGFYDGFAVDNVQITNRNRKILLEHFTNAGAPDVSGEDSFINNIASTQNESVDIRYHASFPNQNDPFNAANTADPSARALFYGTSQIPRTARDGETFNNKYSSIDPNLIEYQKRSLKPSPFEITISFGNNPAELLNVGATVKAVEDFNRPVLVRIAVVEKAINGNDVGLPGNTFHNVVKKLLPDASGTRVNITWLKSQGTYTTVNQSHNPVGFYNKNQMAVVVFVQDETTKEVYQTAYAEPTVIPSGITAIGEELNDQIQLYPNPTKDKVFLQTKNLGLLKYEIYDGLGKIVGEGEFSENIHELDTQKYAAGLYMIRLRDGQGNVGNKKLIINR